MIGVIADPSEYDVVREFFELFKTPWEFYRGDRRYDVVLCAGDGQPGATTKLLVIYAGKRTTFDDQQRIHTGQQRKNACVLSYWGNHIPVYRDTITFSTTKNRLLTDEDSQECTAYVDVSGEKAHARIGYDLFSEVRTLLTVGQPPANASMPALELHIALLRNLITECGLSLVEIPPVPDGHGFIACLTHDVDHPAIRQHKWDHTTFGFLYRAMFGSLRNFLRGRLPVQDLLTNWAAAFKLPFVHLGLAKDFWHDFDDRYLELEGGLHSTYFVIPFKNCQGRNADGPAPTFRASRYEARDAADKIRKLMSAGCEVGLHGIDAWLDSSRGHEELEIIRYITGASEVGVRMHWLYYDQRSPSTLESAGANYDSTVGYNQTVGYRAGTTQVYKPLDASRMLELPLHVMDTALFYPSYLHLSSRQASTLLDKMAENVVHFGGTLTINWHDRSTAPERLWGGCYRDLIQELKSRGAWFSTAGQAVSWFRKRRSAKFVTDSSEPSAVRVTVERGDNLPALRLRIHKARKPDLGGASRPGYGSEDYVDAAVGQTIDTRVASEASK
jgi:hypothetical protein